MLPKYAVSQIVEYIKGKSAIHVARTFMERKRNFVGQHFWAPGFFVSTVGRNEAVIREYILDIDFKGSASETRSKEDKPADQPNLLK